MENKTVCPSRRKEYSNPYHKAYRHRLGISKKYLGEYSKDKSRTIECRRLHRKLYKARKKNGGVLSVKTLQLVYEDNIKKYGTLTCYLCLNPIPFGLDDLEHKIPLSRGGTNDYCNLSVACRHCNRTKHDKTEEEYRSLK